MANQDVSDPILSNLQAVLENPGTYLLPPEETASVAKQFCKTLYESSQKIYKSTQQKTRCPILDELYTSQFDSEQVWQQIDHKFNALTDDSYVLSLSKLLVDTNKLSLGVARAVSEDGLQDSKAESLDEEESYEGDLDSIGGDDVGDSDGADVSGDEDNGESMEEEEIGDMLPEEDDEGRFQRTVEKDQFFSMKEMDKFLDEQDALLAEDEELFNQQANALYDTDDEKNTKMYRYEDLFGEVDESGSNNASALPKKRSVKYENIDALDEYGTNAKDDEFSEKGELPTADDEDMSEEEVMLQGILDRHTTGVRSDDDDDDEEDDKTKSKRKPLKDESSAASGEEEDENQDKQTNFERRAAQLRNQIEALEKEAMSEKPWQMLGEVAADHRPVNSLLEEDVQFQLNAAPVPEITMEKTVDLEQLIIRRIKDKAFDDVERKTRLRDDGDKFRKRIELNHEKSQLSLSQVYEQEYLRLRDGGENKDGEEIEEENEKQIKGLMRSLFSRLDALSSFQYTPRQAPPEVKIITNLSAMSVEEVQPGNVADADRLAPGEIKRAKVEHKAWSEMDATDKKRRRRHIKARHKKLITKEKNIEKIVQKINPGLGNKRAEQRTIEAIREAVLNEEKIIKPAKNESITSEKIYSSSKEFFKALQNEVKMDREVARKKADAKRVGAQRKTTLSSSKFKL